MGLAVEAVLSFSVSGVLVLNRRKFSFLYLREVLPYFVFISTWKLKRISLPVFLFVDTTV